MSWKKEERERKGNSLYQMRTQWESECDISRTSLYVCATSTVWPFTSPWHHHTLSSNELLIVLLPHMHTYHISYINAMNKHSSFKALKRIAFNQPNLFSISFFPFHPAICKFTISAFYSSKCLLFLSFLLPYLLKR